MRNPFLKREGPFGGLAISRSAGERAGETHGFASRPHDRFAFIEEPTAGSDNEKT
jgi:hypothetical protein